METNPFPTDEELHDMLMEELRRSIHVAMPGRIQSYDPVHQVAEIVVGVRDSYPDPEGDGEYIHCDYPVLTAVPILFPRMGRTFLSFPVEEGDAVQILFNSSAIGIWRRSTVIDNVEGIQRALRGVHLVGDVARHNLSHAVAILGLETYGRALNHTGAANATVDALDKPGIVLGYDAPTGTRLLMKPDAAVEIAHGANPVVRVEPGTPAGAPEPVALAALADAIVSSLKNHVAAWTPVPNDGGASLKAHMTSWNPASTAAAFLKAK